MININIKKRIIKPSIFLCIVAIINILISAYIYFELYFSMLNSSFGSKGIAEFFTVIGALIFITSCISLASILLSVTQVKRSIILSIYPLLGIVPLAIENIFTLVITGVYSFIILAFTFSTLVQFKVENLLILNCIFFLLVIIWGMFIKGV